MPASMNTWGFFPFCKSNLTSVKLALLLFAVPRLCWVRLLVQTGTNDSYCLSGVLVFLWATVQINLA